MGKSSTSFKKGVSGNPKGRPSRKTEQAYLNEMVSTTSMAAWKRIVKKAISQAEEGDDKARNWLSNYLMGKPQQFLEIDANVATGSNGMTVGEWLEMSGKRMSKAAVTAAIFEGDDVDTSE